MGTQGQACSAPDELGGVGVPGTALVTLVSFVRSSLAAKTDDLGTGKCSSLARNVSFESAGQAAACLGGCGSRLPSPRELQGEVP